MLFLELEIVYLVIGLFFLAVTAVVTTRDFMPKGAFKKGMLYVGLAVSVLILIHFWITSSRMYNVEEMFNNGETLICENKMHRTISRSILLSKKMGWVLEDHLFKSSDYERDFHSSRCVEWIGSEPEFEEAMKVQREEAHIQEVK